MQSAQSKDAENRKGIQGLTLCVPLRKPSRPLREPVLGFLLLLPRCREKHVVQDKPVAR